MDGDLDELRASVQATRANVRASIRSLRTTGQFLADLEDRIDAVVASRTAEEAQRYGTEEEHSH